MDEAEEVAWNGSAWVDSLAAVSAIQNLPLLCFLCQHSPHERCDVKAR